MLSRNTTTTTAAELDEIALYDGAADDYDVRKDPRCLWGWGPDGKSGCTCMFGHACFRPFGHGGKCWDAGESPTRRPNPLPCWTSQRPKDWDERGREEANQ